jgi:hypothetical protein
MWKAVLAGAAAIAIAGCSSVYAQDRSNTAPTAADAPRSWQPGADDISAFTDARVAALKAGLKLTPAQEKNWPAFEQAYREMAKVRTDQRLAFRQQRQDRRSGAPQDVDPINRLQQRADAMLARGAALKKVSAAAGPLYQSLDDGQKHGFVMLSRLMGTATTTASQPGVSVNRPSSGSAWSRERAHNRASS